MMSLVTPKYIALDSASLGKASHDWSAGGQRRAKARDFLARLRDCGIYVVITLTHAVELLRHADDRIVETRRAFLRAVPLVAWIRPYDRGWYPGSIVDLLKYELHAIVHAGKRDWRSVVDYVRADLWETGCGHELFDDENLLWPILQAEFARRLHQERFIASISRTDPGHIKDLTLREIEQMPRRAMSEVLTVLPPFETELTRQLECHGDRRLESSQQAACDFSRSLVPTLRAIGAHGGDPVQHILEHFEIPEGLTVPEMTVGEIGELGVYIKRLRSLGKDLHPSANISVQDVPPDSLPSYVLARKLAAIQRKAERVSGSDLGDGHIAPLTLYSDGVEVDKRTQEYLSQLQRADDTLVSLMNPFFRSGDYDRIPDLFSA